MTQKHIKPAAVRTESGGTWARDIGDQYNQIARSSTNPMAAETNAAEAGKYYAIAARMDAALPAQSPTGSHQT